MKTEDLQERLDDIEPILVSQSKRLAELENKEIRLHEIKFPDYGLLFEEVKSEIRTAAKLQQHNLTSPAEELKQQITEFKTIAEQIPKVVIPVKHYHQISVKAKMFITGGLLILGITVVMAMFSLHLYQENRQLHESNLRLQLIRQYYPIAARWADKVVDRDARVTDKSVKEKQSKKLSSSESEFNQKLYNRKLRRKRTRAMR